MGYQMVICWKEEREGDDKPEEKEETEKEPEEDRARVMESGLERIGLMRLKRSRREESSSTSSSLKFLRRWRFLEFRKK